MPSMTSTKSKSRFGVFMDALEDYELVVSLHGTASVEADLARAAVRMARENAIQAWRELDAA